MECTHIDHDGDPYMFDHVTIDCPMYRHQAKTGHLYNHKVWLHVQHQAPYGVYLDIGARDGVLSVFMANHCRSTLVRSFEADHTRFRIIHRNVMRNCFQRNKVMSHNKIVSDKLEQVFSVSDSTGLPPFVPDFEEVSEHGRRLRVGDVMSTKVDHVCSKDSVSFINIDQPWSRISHIIRGASATLARCKPWITMRCTQRKAEAVSYLLRQHGLRYKCREVWPSKHQKMWEPK